MNIFIKESLYLLDYNDNVLDVLFLSTDKDTPGQAYEINIKENNTGFSDLTFKMPSYIINEEGEKVINPKLKVLRRKVEGLEDRDISTGLIPLSKVRYNRVVRYMGEEIINFPGPNGTIVQYPKNAGENPEDYIIEDYTMDYIIQPLDKARQSLKIDLTYTAIDFPRFNLSKKKLGFTIDQNTLTTPELSLWGNTPMNVPGSVQYIPWTAELAQQYQTSNYVSSAAALNSVKQPNKGEVYYVTNAPDTGYYQYNGEGWIKKEAADFVTWEPNPQSGGYPLDDNSIKKLISQTEFTNGILATVFYWPVVIPSYTSSTGVEMDRKTARFEGVTYEKGSFITLTLYNLYDGLELQWTTDQKVGNVAWDWNYLEPNKLYLNPNNACNLLRYILKNTNWSVANDGGGMFIPRSSSTPWFDAGTGPGTGEEGQYYIIRENSPVGSIRPYIYTIMQFHDGIAQDATKELLSIVNTDENDIENFGVKYDVFIEPKEVSRTAEGALGQIELMDSQYSLNVSNANCYNAITSEAKLFNLYPVFDCINKTVALREHAGADYSLAYRAGRNLKTSNIKIDGEKVITKLYVTGGTDAQGSANINIGEAIRVINGVTPTLTCPKLDPSHPDSYVVTNSEIFNNMKIIQEEAWTLLTGEVITFGLNLAQKELVLSFPDNFYERFFPDENSKQNDIQPMLLADFTTKKIWLRYQGNSDNTHYKHCFYIYCSDNIEDYLDEKKQLYKADLTNIKIRRNLKTYTDTFGNVNTAPSGDYAEYIKYRKTNIDGQKFDTYNYLYQMGIGYKGYHLTLDNEGYYEIQEPLNTEESFVLVGPSRVYKFDADNALNQINTDLFAPGNYYYTEEITNGTTNRRYYYCILQNELQDISSNLPYYNNSALNKLNTIAVGSYVFIVLGDGSASVTIQNNGISYVVQDINGNPITYNDWLINNYALRVQVDSENNILQEVELEDGWDPNADEYLVGRSPYGTSYIYNFKYLYDNEWMTKEQILDIYAKNYEINTINIDFFNKYNKALEAARKAYWDAINNLELYESKGDAQLETLMSQYWKDPAKASEDRFSAFPYRPKGEIIVDDTKHMYKANIDYEGEVVKTVYFNIFNTDGCNYLYPNSNTGTANAQNPETEGQYHVVAKALGWEAFKTMRLPINETFTKPSDVVDASDTVSNYNKIINNMKLYYWKAKIAGIDMDNALTVVEELEELFDQWQESLNNIERYLQENYGQYIIEGSYNNTEQPYANLLLQDGLKASDIYAVPDITYGVNVVDASGLIEYRISQQLIANDLVKKLHSLGQIVPKVGDYVSILDEEMGLIKVKGLITTITRRIDDPYQNNLTIDTSYTDADELVGQIITATNTVLNNKDIYGRASIINSKGELQTGTVTNALSTGKNSVSITSTNGKIVVDDNGLTATNPEDGQKLMRYNGTGVLGSSNGGITWRSLMTQDGINANYIDAGTINSTKVSITNGQYDTVILDGSGLTVKTNPGRNYELGYATNDGIVWPQNSNVSVFVGKDANNTGIGYFDGYIKATKGGDIAGWTLSSTALWKGGTQSNPTYYLGSEPILATMSSDTENKNYILKIADKFGVTSTGDLWAAGNVYIKGNGTSKIGPWTITDSAYYNGKSSLSDNSDGVYLGVDGIALGANNNFVVTDAGKLTAKSGKIGGWSINDKNIEYGTTTVLNGSNGKIATKSLECRGGSFSIVNTGWLSIGRVSTHPIVSGLNVSISGGIAFRSGASVTDQGKWVASINSGSKGGIEYGSGSGDHVFKGGNITTSNDIVCGTLMADQINADAGTITGLTSVGTKNLEVTSSVFFSKTCYVYSNKVDSSHQGRTGYVKIGVGLNYHYAVFNNGILTGCYDSKPSGYNEILF